MELLLILLSALVVLAVLDCFAIEFGADSRGGLEDLHAPLHEAL